jgi:dienelactone hydrolase
MATPTITKHVLPGALGDILVDVRAGGRTTPRPAVVVLHGFKGFKDWGMFPAVAERLARAGVTAVNLNTSGSGVDDAGNFVFLDRFGHDTFSAELHDLSAVVDALAVGRLGVAAPTTIGLLGHSRGGGIAILYATRDPRVRALVTWAAISSVERWSPAEQATWRAAGVQEILNTRTGQRLPVYTDVLDDIARHATGTLDIMGAASRLTVPWLLVHGTADDTVSYLEAEALNAASGSSSTRLMLIDGAGHTFGITHPWQGDTLHFREVADATLAWFATHLS